MVRATITQQIGKYIRLFASGFMMGAANLIPGVSGGTMALLLGIYEELIDAVRAVSRAPVLRSLARFRVQHALAELPWRFLLAVGGGALLSVLTLTHFLEWLFDAYPVHVEAFFFGLVAASVLAVGKRVQRWGLQPLLGVVVGAVGVYFILDLVPAHTPNVPWLLFLGAAVASGAMVLPGVSGALVLILLGQYSYALAAVTTRDWLLIAIIALGVGVGLITFARLIGWLFKKNHNLTLAVLTGMVAGSLRKLWPWKEVHGDALDVVGQVSALPSVWIGEAVEAAALALGGFVLVLVLDYWRTSRPPAA